MIIRKATDTDLHAVMSLAQDIFEREQRIPKSLTYIPPEKHPQWWCVESDGQIVATLVAYMENGIWHMGRLTVAETLRGQRIAPTLIQFALKDLFAQGVDELHMEARTATVRILLKFGAEITGPAFPFYEGAVTPLRLRKCDFIPSVTF